MNVGREKDESRYVFAHQLSLDFVISMPLITPAQATTNLIGQGPGSSQGGRPITSKVILPRKMGAPLVE